MDHLEKQQRKIHPKEKNNFLSNIFFLYALKLFRKGFKKDLEENDLYEVLYDYRSKTLGNQLENQWEKQKINNKKLSIVRLLVSCYGFSYFLLGLMQLVINTTLLVLQPYALGKFIGYFKKEQTEITKNDAYFYAALVVGQNIFYCIYRHNYYLLLIGFGIKVRTAFCSFIYRKALKLSPVHLGTISIGKIVTLITKDVEVFEHFVGLANDVWIGFITTIVSSCILYFRAGKAAFAGIGVFFIIMPLQFYLGLKVTSMKMKTCKKSDERLQITQETLSAIRIIKMYTWENIFNTKISKTRKTEVHISYRIMMLKISIIIIGCLAIDIGLYVLLMTYIWLENNITAEMLYFIMTTFHWLAHDLGILFPLGVYMFGELKSATKRIGNVVKTMDILIEEPNIDVAAPPKLILKNIKVTIQNRTILENIDINIEKGLTLITGPVGCGKSFLLKTILQDYQPSEGKLYIQGNISYASQDPWLFPSSIKQNILFGQKYDEKRYQEVLKVCALIYDFELLEAGDSTIVEDRGINLSKGQQARINLARAIYKNSEIYLLDDPLSALDGHVSTYIFTECVKRFLKDKIVILVTHNLNLVPNADDTIIMANGKIKFSAHPSELRNCKHQLDNIISQESCKSAKDTNDKNLDKNSKLITETTTEKKVYHEEKKIGEVDVKIYRKYIKFGGGYFPLFTVFCLFAATQVSLSYTDKIIGDWVNLEEKIANNSLYNSTEDELEQQRTSIFYLYGFLITATTVGCFVRTLALFLFTRTSAIKIHKDMILRVINASMTFFDTNFIGNILNRFSKDMTAVDERIAFSIYQVYRVFFYLIGVLTLIASVNTIFLIPAAICFVVLAILRRYCLPTTRSLKRLDALTKSPIVGHLNATLEGLTTIRAFKAETILRDEFDRHQDLYTSASYNLQCTMRAFAFTLESFCSIFIMLVVLRFLIIDDDTLAGHVGLAISQAFMLTGLLQWGIRQWAEVENQMTSVERALEYTEIQQEDKQGLELQNWPPRGEIKYKNVNLSYTNSTEHVLKNINFTVEPKEKIGVVGRTGAGKSSIISTLFRLYEVEGTITIDDVDTKTLSLEFLRYNISIIPQDPVLFTGTVRENIDPTEKYSDQEIWNAIEISHLKKIIPTLDLQIAEAGSHFSIGQRQLICLARAIIRKNKIIILDEATANMDADTDALIHQTIEQNFRDCTVITIAHKLQSILKCDKVMVMDKGEIKAFDKPSNLLKNEDGIFYRMVIQTGLLKEQ